MVYFGERKITSFLEIVLSKREKQILVSILNYNGKTFSFIVRDLSETIPESTLKSVIRRFRDAGLLEYGNGQSLKLSELGESICSCLNGIVAQKTEHSAPAREVGGSSPSNPIKYKTKKNIVNVLSG